MLDSGTFDPESVEDALQVSDKVIVATETLQTLDHLDKILRQCDKERIIISIDVVDNEIYTKHLKLDFQILRQILEEHQPSQIIILDISNVGCEAGINWKLLNHFAGLESSIIFGGGVTAEDILKLDGNIIDKVLVGTALHQGKIKPAF
jgi:phosphoribosylformimino-5-aminoimidazole carboxamide ribotide isomerase